MRLRVARHDASKATWTSSKRRVERAAARPAGALSVLTRIVDAVQCMLQRHFVARMNAEIRRGTRRVEEYCGPRVQPRAQAAGYVRYRMYLKHQAIGRDTRSGVTTGRKKSKARSSRNCGCTGLCSLVLGVLFPYDFEAAKALPLRCDGVPGPGSMSNELCEGNRKI